LSNKLESIKEDRLRDDTLYLYFTQLGKDMYTLRDISLDDAIANAKYDIDHIYPQSLIKDDSFSNRVLTSRNFNQNIKRDQFLFDINNPELANYNSREAFYKILLNANLITKEKYRRLTQKEMSKNELDGFVNRQLVVTNQAVKSLIDLLKQYKGVDQKDIIYSKGENISAFRKMFDIIKSRDANNYHHAHDAYLNVVVGRVINDYFNSIGFKSYSDIEYMKSNHLTMNIDKLFEKDRQIKLHGSLKTIWKKDETLKIVKHNIYERYDIN
jgi:CRISPR-associated endonuclease Csn1